MSNFGVGILGFGKMGRIRAETLEEFDEFEIRKVFDHAGVDNSAFPVAETIDEIVQDPSIDVVFVCLANYLNKSTTIAALEAGKHVFCEKPPAFNAAEVEEIRQVEARSGKALMYGFNHRHHGAVVKMHDLISSGSFGRILWMRGRYGKSVDANYLTTWRANPELAGGGILLDQGIHMLDLFLYLAGKPFDDVHALVSHLYWNTPGIEDNVFAIMRNNQTGLVCSLHSTMTQWRHLFSLEVFLERGYMVLNGLRTSSQTYGEEELFVAKNRSTAPAATWEDEERFHFTEDNSWAREVELFLQVLKSGEPVRVGSSAESLEVMKLVDQIYATTPHHSEVLYNDLSTLKEDT